MRYLPDNTLNRKRITLDLQGCCFNNHLFSHIIQLSCGTYPFRSIRVFCLGTKHILSEGNGRTCKAMPKNDFRKNEKRWRRKPLFRERRTHPSLRLFSLLIMLALLVTLAWWLELLPVDLAMAELLP
jgi:hypothetical protein